MRNMSKRVLLDMQYLGPVSWLAAMARYSEVVFEQCEHYVKGTYRNRCYISGPNGVQRLSIPLKRGKHQRKVIKEVAVSYDGPWQKIHWAGLEASYRSSPFFEFYEEDFYPFYHEKFPFLFDFNRQLLMKVLELMGMEVDISYTSSYEKAPEGVNDLRMAFHPKKRKRQPLDWYEPPVYPQVFLDRNPFYPDLSILDLLFNEGPNARKIIKDAARGI